MVCGSCHANVSRSSHDLQGYTFGLQPGLIQDSGGFCQIVSSQRENNFSSVSQGPDLVGAFFLSAGMKFPLGRLPSRAFECRAGFRVLGNS